MPPTVDSLNVTSTTYTRGQIVWSSPESSNANSNATIESDFRFAVEAYRAVDDNGSASKADSGIHTRISPGWRLALAK
jgi:hypothetical protein